MHTQLTPIDPLLEANRSITPLPRKDVNVASPVLVTLSPVDNSESINSVQPLNTLIPSELYISELCFRCFMEGYGPCHTLGYLTGK